MSGKVVPPHSISSTVFPLGSQGAAVFGNLKEVIEGVPGHPHSVVQAELLAGLHRQAQAAYSLKIAVVFT